MSKAPLVAELRPQWLELVLWWSERRRHSKGQPLGTPVSARSAQTRAASASASS
ncbi:hypothetical protein ACWEBX_17505 [Streptomyces sp. NPDC005070]